MVIGFSEKEELILDFQLFHRTIRCYSNQQFGCFAVSSGTQEFCAVVQSLSLVWLFATPWTAGGQASLSFMISQSLLQYMSIESVMPSNYLILCRPLLLLPAIPPSIRVFSNELTLCMRWPNIADVKKNSTPLIMKGMQILKTSNARVSD